MKYLLTILFFICAWLSSFLTHGSEGVWQAGVASVNITPSYSMWLAGYASREGPSEGKIHDIWAKALALSDEAGNRGVLVTTDLSGISKEVSDKIRDQLQKGLGLERKQILLNSSHTHSGPLLMRPGMHTYTVTPEDLALVTRYTEELTDKIVQMVVKAFENLQTARIYSSNGVTRFQVNRRNNVEATLEQQSELSGPMDHAVPVLKVENMEGDLMAIAFGYACHPTVLNINRFSGDWPGFAQIELERAHPGAVALFFQGAGGDQNPLPRRTIPLARQYGRTIAAAVERVMEEGMEELSSDFQATYREIELDLNTAPTREELEHFCEEVQGYYLRWGKRILGQMDANHTFADSYTYPLQVWRIGQQTLFAMGGEAVVGYAIGLKKIFGHNVFVLGYSNDVMAYIPTATILQEGRYEGATSQFASGMHGTWAYDTEVKIMGNLVDMAKVIGVPIPGNNLLDH
ncbi:MAG: hypothetical protein HKN87_10080 [Saprospiraceae bacterium]|nr:hypothetical protein [Saprospiraceae bacterium]